MGIRNHGTSGEEHGLGFVEGRMREGVSFFSLLLDARGVLCLEGCAGRDGCCSGEVLESYAEEV